MSAAKLLESRQTHGIPRRGPKMLKMIPGYLLLSVLALASLNTPALAHQKYSKSHGKLIFDPTFLPLLTNASWGTGSLAV